MSCSWHARADEALRLCLALDVVGPGSTDSCGPQSSLFTPIEIGWLTIRCYVLEVAMRTQITASSRAGKYHVFEAYGPRHVLARCSLLASRQPCSTVLCLYRRGGAHQSRQASSACAAVGQTLRLHCSAQHPFRDTCSPGKSTTPEREAHHVILGVYGLGM